MLIISRANVNDTEIRSIWYMPLTQEKTSEDRHDLNNLQNKREKTPRLIPDCSEKL